MIHDYITRDYYHDIEKYYTMIDHGHEMAIFKPQRQPQRHLSAY